MISLEENGNLELDIYPNPATSILHVDYTSNSLERVELIMFNSIGQSIFNQVYVSSENLNLEIDVSGWPSGVYQLKVIGLDADINRLVIVN